MSHDTPPVTLPLEAWRAADFFAFFHRYPVGQAPDTEYMLTLGFLTGYAAKLENRLSTTRDGLEKILALAERKTL